MAVIRINNTDIVTPSSFVVTINDIDDGETTTRTSDGTLNRDRVAVKRQLGLEWGMLTWSEISNILSLTSETFCEVRYPDPMTGQYETKTFYVGSRPSPVMVVIGEDVFWESLKFNFTER